MKKVIEKYKLVVNNVPADITIYADPEKEYVPIYELIFPIIEPATEAILDSIREKMVQELEIRPAEVLNPGEAARIKNKFTERTADLIKERLPNLPEDKQKTLLGILSHQSLGLGPIEILLQDRSLEEVVVNSSKGPIWVYHIKLGWLKTNLTISSEDQIYNYAASIGRRVGEQITNLNPLMDAYLTSGDRTNATLFPISSQGNTLTIRKFARRPWTITDFMEMGTLSSDVAAFLWLAIQYELNTVIAGGTACGKTSFLNALTCFIPPNHRVLSIEDSVTGDTEIIVKKNGNIEVRKIEDVVNDIAGSAEGKIDPKGIEVLSLDDEMKIVPVKPTTLFKHKVKKDIYEILTSTGRRIKVTQDHSLFKLGGNTLEEVKPRDLSNGDFLATPRVIPYRGRKLETINLMDHLSVFNGLIVGKPIKDFLITTKPNDLKSYGITKSNLQCWRRGSFIPTRMIRKLIDDKKIKFSKKDLKNVRLRLRNSFQEYPVLFRINDDLLQLFGLWIGDGSYDYRNENKVMISNSDKECIDLTRRVAKYVGANIYEMNDKVSLSVNSTFLYRLMRFVLGFDGYSKTKRIPGFVFNLSNRQIARILQGYFSADGTVKRNEVSCASQSLGLLRDIQTLFLRFGIISRINDYERADDCNEMSVSSVDNVKLFKKHVDFMQKRKQDKVCVLADRVPTHSVYDVIPIRSELGMHLRRVKPVSSWYFSQWNMGRPHLQNIMGAVDDDWEWYPTFNNLANSDVFWDKVVEVKKVERVDYVYDISTPPFENFLANNFIVHNTREVQLPDFLHWIPLTTRPPNPEGKGEVSMLQIMINSLRMRPDRMIVGEMRRKEEAQVLFEAINTGHSVYSTLHANTAEEAFRRLVNPPIDIPAALLSGLQLIVVMHRDRRKNIRRVLQIAELIPSSGLKESRIDLNVIFQWIAAEDKIISLSKSYRVMNDIKLYTGMSEKDIERDLKEKKEILEWLIRNKVKDINEVGRIISEYYRNPEMILKMVRKGGSPLKTMSKKPVAGKAGRGK